MAYRIFQPTPSSQLPINSDLILEGKMDANSAEIDNGNLEILAGAGELLMNANAMQGVANVYGAAMHHSASTSYQISSAGQMRMDAASGDYDFSGAFDLMAGSISMSGNITANNDFALDT